MFNSNLKAILSSMFNTVIALATVCLLTLIIGHIHAFVWSQRQALSSLPEVT